MAAGPHELEAPLRALLKTLNIATTTHRHPPLETVQVSKALRGSLTGGHIKNLFLRDKKKTYWLVTVEEDRTVDLKKLRQRLGAKGSLSFGGTEVLREVLGIEPGAVTPLALMNDRTGRVRFAIDRALLEDTLVNVHPLHNQATMAIEPAELMRFLEAIGHVPQLLEFESAGDETE